MAHPSGALALASRPTIPLSLAADRDEASARTAPLHRRAITRSHGANSAPDGYVAHVLLVEPDPSAREALSRYLRGRGFRVWVAATLPEARAMIAHRLPDLALLDLDAAPLAGAHFIRALRGREQSALLPVIALTTLRTAQFIRDLLDLGADDVIAKPVELGVIAARITALLRRDSRLRQALTTASAAPDPLPIAYFSAN